jgi:hypothetical protein
MPIYDEQKGKVSSIRQESIISSDYHCFMAQAFIHSFGNPNGITEWEGFATLGLMGHCVLTCFLVTVYPVSRHHSPLFLPLSSCLLISDPFSSPSYFSLDFCILFCPLWSLLHVGDH